MSRRVAIPETNRAVPQGGVVAVITGN